MSILLKKIFYGVVFSAAVIFLIIVGNGIYDFFGFASLTDYAGEDFLDSGSDISCNVQGVKLVGFLDTRSSVETEVTTEVFFEDPAMPSSGTLSSREIVELIDQGEADENIKAILVEVDSEGGYPVAGEEVANALKKAEKPTVAIIRKLGASAAYWAASGADYIFASKNSDVGGIGVTSSYLDYSGQNQKEGIKFIQLNVGKFKDIGNPEKPITEEEKQLLLEGGKVVYNNFVSDIAENRKLSIEKVTEIADGASVLGEEAKQLGLIDEIGSWNEALAYIENKIGESVEICW